MDKQFMQHIMANGGGVKNHRLEQMKAVRLLRKLFPESEVNIIPEYEVQLPIPFQDIKQSFCQPDIALISKMRPQCLNMVIRMMGPIHETEHQKRKDEDQFYCLIANGYLVVDFWYFRMPNLWKTGIKDESEKKANIDASLKEIRNELLGKLE